MTRVLVVEDDENIRDNIVAVLEAEGYTALSAENGLAGVASAQAHLPDLIICDIMMPGLDGFDVLDELHQDPVTATIPFIFSTALADKSDVRRGMERGADDYLTKPFTHAELLNAIEARLAKQAVLNRKFQKKLDDLRSNIATSLPHELRTPLTGILSGSALLQEDASLSPDQAQELVQIIHASAQRLNRLVANYLLYAELEIELANPEAVPALQQSGRTDAKSVIMVAALQKAQAAGRETDLSLELEEAMLRVEQTHLEKIVEELLDNAFKYSKDGTPVRVTAAPDRDRFVLSVADHGRGMTAGQIADVGAFVQFERKIHEQQGSGLGLIIVKCLAELYGGRLDVESKPGKQTNVRVVLPIGCDA
jgi:two-component system, sensor histidine kinase and response regulator